MIDLDVRVRDRLTGFQGVAVGRAEYAHDTPSIQIAYCDHNGMPQTIWLSESRLEQITEAKTSGGFGQ